MRFILLYILFDEKLIRKNYRFIRSLFALFGCRVSSTVRMRVCTRTCTDERARCDFLARAHAVTRACPPPVATICNDADNRTLTRKSKNRPSNNVNFSFIRSARTHRGSST